MQLFARAKKGGNAGQIMEQDCFLYTEMANQKDKLRQAAFNINHKIEGKLRIGSFSSITALWMPDAIHFFNEKLSAG